MNIRTDYLNKSRLRFSVPPRPSSSLLREVPKFFQEKDVFDIWAVDTNQTSLAANQWILEQEKGITPSIKDEFKVCLLIIDMQIDFCHPLQPLFCGGKTGCGAAEDVAKLSRYIYQNLDYITEINCTLDSHYRYSIFYPDFWINMSFQNPLPYSTISSKDVLEEEWIPIIDGRVGAEESVKMQIVNYLEELEKNSKSLIIWPQHCTIGNVGHALSPLLHESVEFHSALRMKNPVYINKGENKLFEQFSAIGLGTDASDQKLAERLLSFDMLIVAGEASSHCVKETVEDLIKVATPLNMIDKIVLLEDAMSAVVARDKDWNIIPNGDVITDFSDCASDAIKGFRRKGTKISNTSQPIQSIQGYGISR